MPCGDSRLASARHWKFGELLALGPVRVRPCIGWMTAGSSLAFGEFGMTRVKGSSVGLFCHLPVSNDASSNILYPS
jgi:hypothetical protein